MSVGRSVPVLILKEGSRRSRGKEAQHNNIMAAKIIAETVKSSLGPKGMDKMLVDSLGDVTITSDGKTILEEIDVEHPAAKMMVNNLSNSSRRITLKSGGADRQEYSSNNYHRWI